MRLPHSKIVHVGLIVLDHARLVRADQVCARVGKGESTDGDVVSLENGLKIKGESVPEREFAASRAGQDTSAVWSPL
jgi:hypothetical protein